SCESREGGRRVEPPGSAGRPESRPWPPRQPGSRRPCPCVRLDNAVDAHPHDRRDGMGRVQHSVDIDAPLEVCWALNADASRLTEWNKAILEVRDVSGPLDRVGTTYTGVVKA